MSHPPETTTQKGQSMLLGNKNSVIYGGGGSIGGAVAREFSREGARVFLVGRTRESLETVANDIEADGGAAEVAVLDALDEQAVDEQAQAVVTVSRSTSTRARAAARGGGGGAPAFPPALNSVPQKGSPVGGTPAPAD